MITVCGSRRPERRLFFERANDRIVVGDINFLIERDEAGLMGKQLRKRDFAFTALRKFRPKLRDALLDSDRIFLQDMEETGAAESFRRRPDENQCVRGPRFLTVRIAKSTMEIEQRVAILPNRDRCPEFAKLRKIFFE